MAFAILSILRSLLRRAGGMAQAAVRPSGIPAPVVTNGPTHSTRRAASARPLRIVHKESGRLVISGRMADVCAELERLAALEALGGQALLPTR
jgi:hypothetical protein